MEFAVRFGEPPQGVKDLLFQMKIKILGEKVGLESISIVNNQLVLSYPPLSKGVNSRGLLAVDPAARAGKNAYWINLAGLKDESWQTVLMRVLRKLRDSQE